MSLSSLSSRYFLLTFLGIVSLLAFTPTTHAFGPSLTTCSLDPHWTCPANITFLPTGTNNAKSNRHFLNGATESLPPWDGKWSLWAKTTGSFTNPENGHKLPANAVTLLNTSSLAVTTLNGTYKKVSDPPAWSSFAPGNPGASSYLQLTISMPPALVYQGQYKGTICYQARDYGAPREKCQELVVNAPAGAEPIGPPDTPILEEPPSVLTTTLVNQTNDVTSGGSPNATVTSIQAPTLTPSGGGVNSDTLSVAQSAVPANYTWGVTAQLTGNLTGPRGTVDASYVSLNGLALNTSRIIQSGMPHTTSQTNGFTLRFNPPGTVAPGDYTGTIRFTSTQYRPGDNEAAGQHQLDIPVTIHVLGYIEIDKIVNLTNDVRTGGTPNAAVTGFDFPTQTSKGGVHSDSFAVHTNANTPYNISLHISKPFTRVGDVGVIKPANTFAWKNTLADSPNWFSGANLSRFQSNVSPGSPSVSNTLILHSGAWSAGQAGDYEGEFTITITAE